MGASGGTSGEGFALIIAVWKPADLIIYIDKRHESLFLKFNFSVTVRSLEPAGAPKPPNHFMAAGPGVSLQH